MTARGRWDRTSSSDERASSQRLAVVAAAARSTFELGRAVTVSDVVRRAGVGRNTFYVHFEDVAEALRAAEKEALARISNALTSFSEARTPVERLRALTSAWLRIAATEPHFVTLVIRGDGTPRGAHVLLREAIEHALRNVAASARTAGTIGRPVDNDRLRALTGAFIAFAERIIEENRWINGKRTTEELVDFSLRALR